MNMDKSVALSQVLMKLLGFIHKELPMSDLLVMNFQMQEQKHREGKYS